MNNFSHTSKGYFYGLLAVIFFGLTLPATRMAITELPAIFVALGRSVIAAIMGVTYLFMVKAKRPAKQQLLRLAIIALCVVFGFPLFSSMAMQTLPASHGAVVMGIFPLATTMAAIIFAHEKPGWKFWVWGMVGTTTVITFALIDGDNRLYAADSYLLLAVAFASTGYAISGNLARTMPGIEIISWALIMALPAIALTAVFIISDINWHASPQSWTAFFYIGIFPQFLGLALWYRGMALAGISHIGQIQLFQIFITLAASAILLDEPISYSMIFFALIVVFAVFMGRRTQVIYKP